MVNVIFIGIDPGAGLDEGPQEGTDRGLLNVLQHSDDHLITALNHPQNGGLLLLQRTPSPCSFQPPPMPLTAFFCSRRGALYGRPPRRLRRTPLLPTGAAQADALPPRPAIALSSVARRPYSTRPHARFVGWIDSPPSG